VDDIVEKAKESMSQDATAIRMQTQNLIAKQQKLCADAHVRCEAALAAANTRMKEASKACCDAYEEALNKQLQTVVESSITEDTLNQEMVVAAEAHRDNIQKMTAIPPLVVDEHRLQLQIRCAAAEENSEDLQRELKALKGGDAEGKIDGLQKDLEDLRLKFAKAQEKYSAQSVLLENFEKENELLRRANKNINSTYDKMKRASLMDEGVMVGLKKKLETAESELESLKRKRTDSISPERTITGILKRPSAASPSGQNVPSSSVQPTPKKSRNRKNRWDSTHSSSVPNKPPPISSNRDGLKRGYEHTPQIQRKDPVLHKSLSSARKKQDVIRDIEESAATLGLARSDFSLVFHRFTIEDQVTVIKKALAYVETIITSTCVHLLKAVKAGGNPVQTYLDTLSLSQVAALRKDVDDALEQCEDSGRYMAVYQGGDDLPSRVRRQCFTKDGKPLKPHKLTDMLKNLHVRLGCHSQHCIPIGFYYAKWSEKLHFHLARAVNNYDHSGLIRRFPHCRAEQRSRLLKTIDKWKKRKAIAKEQNKQCAIRSCGRRRIGTIKAMELILQHVDKGCLQYPLPCEEMYINLRKLHAAQDHLKAYERVPLPVPSLLCGRHSLGRGRGRGVYAGNKSCTSVSRGVQCRRCTRCGHRRPHRRCGAACPRSYHPVCLA
jgi:hypothetical protein